MQPATARNGQGDHWGAVQHPAAALSSVEDHLRGGRQILFVTEVTQLTSVSPVFHSLILSCSHTSATMCVPK